MIKSCQECNLDKNYIGTQAHIFILLLKMAVILNLHVGICGFNIF